MSQNYNNYNQQYYQQPIPQQSSGPNAVSINIISPQAYGTYPNSSLGSNVGYAPIYGPNSANLPIYPANYNNSIINNSPYAQNPQMVPNGMQTQQGTAQMVPNNTNTNANTSTENKTNTEEQKNVDDKKEDNQVSKKTKNVVPLNDDYIKNLENYLNDDNSKIRLIAAKEVMQRFKEDETRADNKSLVPLLNKILRDPNSAVRFLGLTTLQLGYSTGDDETISILKEIQAVNNDKIGEDQLLASEILLKLSAGAIKRVPDKQTAGKGDKK